MQAAAEAQWEARSLGPFPWGRGGAAPSSAHSLGLPATRAPLLTEAACGSRSGEAKLRVCLWLACASAVLWRSGHTRPVYGG